MRSINPKQFINEVGMLKKQFSGNEQHDAQELLAFLLDGLSEETNLVHDKPYVQHPDSDNRPDATLADIWWTNHLLRDLSVVQAIFTGQFKSVMTCQCGYTSARFEPFNFLPVPLPAETLRYLHAYFLFCFFFTSMSICICMCMRDEGPHTTQG
jgi:ubiquitin carboxyl-terminal hydrolase 6/32